MRSRWIVLVAGLAAALAAGCSGGDRPAGSGGGGQGGALEVVATTTQVADFARVVGGDRVRVTNLIKPNVDAHDYEPSPADVDAIARADVVLQNGGDVAVEALGQRRKTLLRFARADELPLAHQLGEER